MLFVVATPIGNPKDISLRALEALQSADIVIGEERRLASTLLKRLNIEGKEIYLLNEHSRDDDLDELLTFCRERNVVLISDCGTPSFYDPGYQLVALCRQHKIKITAIPGASSLMTLLSLVSEKVTQFYFAGFLPADQENRALQWKRLAQKPEAIVLMDTPYRLIKMLQEIQTFAPGRRLLLGLNLTQEQEFCPEGTAEELLVFLKHQQIEKAEFIVLMYALRSAPPSFSGSSKKSFKGTTSREPTGFRSQKSRPSPRRHQR